MADHSRRGRCFAENNDINFNNCLKFAHRFLLSPCRQLPSFFRLLLRNFKQQLIMHKRRAKYMQPSTTVSTHQLCHGSIGKPMIGYTLDVVVNAPTK